MRSILSISVPPKKLAVLKKRAKAHGVTVSAYIIRKIEEDIEHEITEKELLQYAREAKSDVKHRKVKELKYPEDFLREIL